MDVTGNNKAAEHMPRRTFLRYTIGAISSFMGIVAGVPIIGYVTSPLQSKEEAHWINLGKVKDFAAGLPQIIPFSITRQDGWVQVSETRTCWVMPLGNNRFNVFNGRCTHLGCAFSWKADGQNADKFVCPCHEGVYDREGRVLSGPPPRPLDRLQYKVENDELLVLYQDFRPGIEEQVPL